MITFIVSGILHAMLPTTGPNADHGYIIAAISDDCQPVVVALPDGQGELTIRPGWAVGFDPVRDEDGHPLRDAYGSVRWKIGEPYVIRPDLLSKCAQE